MTRALLVLSPKFAAIVADVSDSMTSSHSRFSRFLSASCVDYDPFSFSFSLTNLWSSVVRGMATVCTSLTFFPLIAASLGNGSIRATNLIQRLGSLNIDKWVHNFKHIQASQTALSALHSCQICSVWSSFRSQWGLFAPYTYIGPDDWCKGMTDVHKRIRMPQLSKSKVSKGTPIVFHSPLNKKRNGCM